jgi:hypothetical protein
MDTGTCRSQATFGNQLESAQRAELSCGSRGIPMTAPYPIRKACPVCGKPMKVVPEDQMGRERYVCTRCEHDPLQDPAIRKWTDGPLRPPAK